MSPTMLTGLFLLEMLLQNNTVFILRMMTMQLFYTGKNSWFFIMFWFLLELKFLYSLVTILTLVVEQKHLAGAVNFFWPQCLIVNFRKWKRTTGFSSWVFPGFFLSSYFLTPFYHIIKVYNGRDMLTLICFIFVYIRSLCISPFGWTSLLSFSLLVLIYQILIDIFIISNL